MKDYCRLVPLNLPLHALKREIGNRIATTLFRQSLHADHAHDNH
jgi:hypothetical protein